MKLHLAPLVLWGCVPPGPTHCDELSELRGQLVCSQSVDTEALWQALTVPGAGVDREREGKYLVPGEPGSPVDALVVNANVYPLHSTFLADVYGSSFPNMSQLRYSNMVADPDDDTFFAGDLLGHLDHAGERWFGFTVWDNSTAASATVSWEEVADVYTQLSGVFTLDDLAFVPNSAHQQAAVLTWPDGFPIRADDPFVRYEAYTPGVGYGTIRRYATSELAQATFDGAYGSRDILVLDEAPFDVERVVSGVVTGSRQGVLSHVNVRSAARGTPNCFVQDALETFSAWDDRLVRLTCSEDRWEIAAASLEEAMAWWEDLQPTPADIVPADLSDGPIVDLLDLPTDSPADRTAAVARFGSKGAQLGVLYQRIPADLQLKGVVVPMAHYDRFMATAGWEHDLGDGPAWVSFATTLDAWLVDPVFLSDAAERRGSLAALDDAIRSSAVDPELLDELAAAIRATWGDDTTTVRFRSSSNAEDALSFSGAGLYASTSACLADQLDADDAGPSRCDPDQPDERTLERALLKVWASLWSMRAYEERAWYGIDPHEIAMGVLVNTRSKDEQVNAVAFTGSPTDADDRYLVNAQIGTHDVVSPDPGIVPEVARLTVQEGVVARIERLQGSSLSTAHVLSDDQLQRLGAALGEIDAVMPLDTTPAVGSTVLWDTEWKVLDDGRLIVKQVRPFLR